jgi:hypothetical protein
MTQELNRRWKANETPFDGETLATSDLVLLAELRPLLQAIATELERRFPDAELQCHNDWHSHDGYITTAKPVGWRTIASWFVSDETLYQARAADTFVRVALHPADHSFLLRFHILERDEDPAYPGVWGDFDLTGPSELVADLQGSFRPHLAISPAKVFFDKNYAG